MDRGDQDRAHRRRVVRTMNSPGSTPRVLIAGAGIGGLTAALALLRRGIDVDLYEQAHELREVGAGVQISPNGSRVLYALGVGEEIQRLSCEPAGKEVRLWNTGRTWKLFDLGADATMRYGSPYFTVYRADLHLALAAAVRRAKPDAIHLNARCESFTQTDQSVTVRLESGEEVTGTALVGADGVHSRIRGTLFGQDSPTFSGIMAWRGVIPIERLPERLRRPVGTNWIGPGGHIISYPLRRGELMNFAGYVERSDWLVESWSVQGTTEEYANDFKGWHEDIHAHIRNIDTPYKWALLVRAPLERWTVGRVTLLGDACHPTLPFLAQGAVMALEDGLILGRALEKHGDDIAGGLAAYEEARRERTNRVVRGSSENTKRFHNPLLNDPAEAEKYVDREWAGDKIRDRYEWLFTYDATRVPV
jgi:salicylate hydroxylase